MTTPLTPTTSDSRQLSLWIEMTDLAARYHSVERDMLGAVPMELILAIVEGGAALSGQRRQAMIGAGALILRLIEDEQNQRRRSTADMLMRLGIEPSSASDEG